MKKIIFALVASIFVSNLFAQSAYIKVRGVNNEIIAAKIINSDSDSRAVTQMKGRSEAIMEIKKATSNEIYIFGVNDKIMFFTPIVGDTITIEMNSKTPLAIGAGAEVNNFLFSLSDLLFYTLPNRYVNNYMFMVHCQDYSKVDYNFINTEDYPEKVLDLRDDCYKMIKKSKVKDKELKAKLNYLINDIYWEAIFYTYQCVNYDKIAASKSLLKVVSSFNFDDPRFMSLTKKDMILENYFRAQEEMENLKFDLKNYIAAKASTLKNQDIRDYYVIKELKNLVNKKETINILDLINSCEPIISDKVKDEYLSYKKEIKDYLSKDLLDGVATMPFSFENQNGDSVSLSDFRGKYVLIDFWATWCGPCVQQMKYMNDLERELKGENIEFISISLDTPQNKSRWKEFLKENNMHGTTLISQNGFKVPFVKYYSIKSIPRFMLIAPDGIMIANNCWAPSDPKLKRYIMTLIKKTDSIND